MLYFSPTPVYNNDNDESKESAHAVSADKPSTDQTQTKNTSFENFRVCCYSSLSGTLSFV